MPQIAPVHPEAAHPEAAATLAAVRKKLGTLPNLFTTLAHAPAALNGYVRLQETLAKGRLSARQREIVALAVGQVNACQYCLSAHTLLGRGAGLSDDEVTLARRGQGHSAQDAAVARLSQQLVSTRGALPAGALLEARSAGVDDGLVLEVVAHVALNVLTNYTNHVAGTDVDFPVVEV